MTTATTVKTHFGVTIDDEIKSFCGTRNIGPSLSQDKFATESTLVNCGACQYEIDRVARYALRNATKLPKYVRAGEYGQCKW